MSDALSCPVVIARREVIQISIGDECCLSLFIFAIGIQDHLRSSAVDYCGSHLEVKELTKRRALVDDLVCCGRTSDGD